MATEKPLNELKCRDCLHCVLSGWWDPQNVCDISGFPINPDESACISIEQRIPKQR